VTAIKKQLSEKPEPPKPPVPPKPVVPKISKKFLENLVAKSVKDEGLLINLKAAIGSGAIWFTHTSGSSWRRSKTGPIACTKGFKVVFRLLKPYLG